jgi:hypothetical protein
MVKNYTTRQKIDLPPIPNVQYGNTDQISWIKLKYGELTIDENGYPIEKKSFNVLGYWAELGIADLVPNYFEID